MKGSQITILYNSHSKSTVGRRESFNIWPLGWSVLNNETTGYAIIRLRSYGELESTPYDSAHPLLHLRISLYIGVCICVCWTYKCRAIQALACVCTVCNAHIWHILHAHTRESRRRNSRIFLCRDIQCYLSSIYLEDLWGLWGIFILKRLQKHNHPQAKEKDVGANTTITSLEYVFEMIIHVRLERAHTYMYTYV